VEQFTPSAPDVEAKVGPVEKASIVVGKLAHEYGKPEVKIAAVGKRSDQYAGWREKGMKLLQESRRITQVLQYVGAEDVVECTAQIRNSLIEVRPDELDLFRGLCSRAFNAGNSISPASQYSAEVCLATTHVENGAPVSPVWERLEYQAVAAIGAFFQTIRQQLATALQGAT
jgi:hypothetical protein